MALGDMQLCVGRIKGYNNEIMITTANYTLGLNNDINEAITQPDAPTDTGKTGLVKPQTPWEPSDIAGGNFALATSVTSLAYSLQANIANLMSTKTKMPCSLWVELQ